MTTELNFQIFKREDYTDYYRWFEDPDLNKWLGPMKEEGEEWLTHVLKEQSESTGQAGNTYSIWGEHKLVGVIGILYPDKESSSYAITSIAVNPSLRNKGLGKRILKRLLELYSLKNGEYWVAYVDLQNVRARSFFEKNGWKSGKESRDEDNMLLFELI